jgi:hypothetical protein
MQLTGHYQSSVYGWHTKIRFLPIVHLADAASQAINQTSGHQTRNG